MWKKKKMHTWQGVDWLKLVQLIASNKLSLQSAATDITQKLPDPDNIHLFE